MPLVSPWKNDFPLFTCSESANLCYLDSAATCLTPKVVSQAIFQYQCFSHANSHKGLYQLSAKATAIVEQARVTVANFIHSENAQQIAFTPSTTHAINVVANSYVKPRLSAKSNIVITCAEHHANLLPWQALCQQTGAQLRVVNIDEMGRIDTAHLQTLLDINTVLLAICHVSNVLGVTNPIAEICHIAHQKNISVLVDGAQAIAHQSVNVEQLHCDFYVFSAHKMYGPVGCGVLYGKAEHFEKMQPEILGGGIVEKVTLDESTFIKGPQKFEAGSHNVAAICGLASAIDYINNITWPTVEQHIHDLNKYLHRQLRLLPFIESVIPLQEQQTLVCFQVKGVHSHDIATLLDGDNIAVRAGHHCAQPLHQHLGLHSSLRVSLGIYNGIEDIDSLVRSLKHAYQLLVG